MIIRLREDQTVWDFCLMVTGGFDTIIQFMQDNGIDSLDENLAGRVFDVTYNTNDTFVNFLFLNQINISSGDLRLYNELYTNPDGEFNSDFNSEFKN